MNQRQIEQFRRLLDNKMQALMGKADMTVVDGVSEETAPFADPTDRATLEEGRNLHLRVRDRERKLINKIRQALDRIEKGHYGYCKVCGEPIPPSRLQARPEAELCIECKEEMELREQRKIHLR